MLLLTRSDRPRPTLLGIAQTCRKELAVGRRNLQSKTKMGDNWCQQHVDEPRETGKQISSVGCGNFSTPRAQLLTYFVDIRQESASRRHRRDDFYWLFFLAATENRENENENLSGK